MRTHVVVDGDCLSSLAEKFGFRSWRTIYDHPDNAELRSKRPNPNLLAPGDVVAIPDREARVEDAATGQRHTFVAKRETCAIELRFLGHDGSTLARRDVRLVIDGGAEQQLKTDGQGRIRANIARNASKGVAMIGAHTFTFGLGTLRPVEKTPEDLTPLQQRLENLGFHCPANGRLDAATSAAVRAYQTERKLPPTGELDGATRAAILGEHTC